MACVSSWRGGLQTSEPQLSLAANVLKLRQELKLDKSQDQRLSRLQERSRLI